MIIDCELEEGEDNIVSFVNNLMKENPTMPDNDILNTTMRVYRCTGLQARVALNTVV